MKKVVIYSFEVGEVSKFKQFLSEISFEIIKDFMNDECYSSLSEIQSISTFLSENIERLNADNFVGIIEREEFWSLGIDSMETFENEYNKWLKG